MCKFNKQFPKYIHVNFNVLVCMKNATSVSAEISGHCWYAWRLKCLSRQKPGTRGLRPTTPVVAACHVGACLPLGIDVVFLLFLERLSCYCFNNSSHVCRFDGDAELCTSSGAEIGTYVMCNTTSHLMLGVKLKYHLVPVNFTTRE